jgi:hypothetical protein
MAYAYYIEPNWLAVTRVTLKSAKLKPGAKPIKIALFSDLHSEPKPRLENKLSAVLRAERPDLILFAGDTINTPPALPIARGCLLELSKIAPTYVVKGNWDSITWYKQNLFNTTNTQELKSDSWTNLTLNDTQIALSGVPVGSEDRIKGIRASVPADRFTIFLYHYPDEIFQMADSNIDLYCAGHTHGGQIALPFYGALITYSRFDKQFESGLYKVKNTNLYVNRGIGMEGGDTPRMRFCARPELTIIEVQPQ